MTDSIDQADERALARFGVDAPTVQRTMGEILGGDVDDGDLYFEHRVNEAFGLEEGRVKTTRRSVRQGVGVRAVSEDRTGYAHSDEIEGGRLLEAARAARAIARDGGQERNVALTPRRSGHDLYPVSRAPVDEETSRKVELLEAVEDRARSYDPRIQQVFANVASEMRTVAIVGSDGRLVLDERPLMRLHVTCVAAEGSNRQSGTAGCGGRAGFDTLVDGDAWTQPVDEAARQAVLNLSAVDCPAGAMDVVLGRGWPGILLHEAVGHGLEGDFNRKETSAFSGLVGEQVASDQVTIVDDGTIAGRRGSLNVDDEGTPTERTTLIENGVLRGYMQDRLNARLMGMSQTGNGRRESYAEVPMPRMTNTFMLPGEHDPEEIIRGVRYGIYAVAFGGGQVDITSGKFVFSGSEAYLIEDGRITSPVKGATFIGNGPDVLTRVDAVGHDLELDPGIGTCGKDGQTVPVGVGMPTVRVKDLTVGGVST